MASPVDTSVKFITDNMPGAPVLSGTAGALISVLDALLVTGFGLRTATSVTVAGGVATVTLASNALNANLLHSVILVDGVAAPMADLNGEQRVTAATSTTLQFATSVADGTATGTITVKSAPAGWEKLYSGTNKAVYRSTHVQSAKHCLRVDDTGTTSARVVGYETMSDVDSGVAPFPTAAQFSGGGYWWKSVNANSTANPYALFADSRAILKAVLTWSTYKNCEWRGFGEAIPLAAAGDAWVTFLSSGGSSSGTSGGFQRSQLDGLAAPSPTYGTLHVARAFSGIGGSAPVTQVPSAGAVGGRSGMDATFGAGASSVTGMLTLARLYLADSVAGAPPRAIVPGVRYVPHSAMDSVFPRFSVVDGAGTDAGRRFMAVPVGDGVTNTGGVAFVDITGPWRD